MLNLIDTSIWIEASRKGGRAEVRAKVSELMEREEAAWCSIVELELWAGVGTRQEREWIRGLGRVLVSLPITDQVWRSSFELAERARARGVTATATDLLIAATGQVYDAHIYTLDKQFNVLAQLAH